MQEKLFVDAPPSGETRLTDWVRMHSDMIGSRYASEMRRRRDQSIPYPPQVLKRVEQKAPNPLCILDLN